MVIKRLCDSEEEEETSRVLEKAMEPKETTSCFVYTITLLSAVGGFLFGYDTGIVSGAMVFIRDDFDLNTWWQEIVVSVTILGAWIFSMVAGYATDAFGRKPVIIVSSIAFAVGSLLMGFAINKEILLSGRLVVGAGVGLASMTVPMYIAEVAPAHVRGSLVTINNCFITGGQFVAALTAGALSYHQEDGWRYMLGLAAIPAVIQLVGFLFMPESPRWLVRRGRYQEALETLHRIRGSNLNIEEEFDSIKDSCLQQEREQAESGGTSVFEQVYADSTLKKALFVGCLLQMVQQLSGINTVMYYSATIIEMSGVSDKSTAIWLASATAGVNFFCTFIGFFLVERIGRRPLTLFSLAGVIVSLCALAAGFQLASVDTPLVKYHDPSTARTLCNTFTDCNSCTTSSSCGFCFNEAVTGYNGTCLVVDAVAHSKSTGGSCYHGSNGTDIWAYEWCPSSYSWVTIVGLMSYLFFFAPGMGPMPWTINSEIYPLWARSVCTSTATSVNWFCNLIVSLTFLSLTQAITKYGAFYLYAGIASLGFLLLFYLLPETKGKSLEELETLFAPDSTSLLITRPTNSKAVKYVHIRGMNRHKTLDEQDSCDEG